MNKSFKIIEKSKIFFIISIILVVASIVCMIIPGMNFGLDFSAGATLEVELAVADDATKDAEYKEAINEFIKGKGFTVENTRNITGAHKWQFDLAFEIDGKSVDKDTFEEAFGDENNGLINDLITFLNSNESDGWSAKVGYSLKENEVVYKNHTSAFTSPDATKSLATKAIIAIVVAIVCMLVYIAIRFKFTSGLAAVIVLAHDVLVMILLTTVFQIKVNTTFIAAIITVVGYSINATIIVFDRIKENLELCKDKGMTDADIANKSISETIRRTIFTTITTLIMIVLIAIIGVDSIREFALPIIFGLLSGVYSAIILSSCVWVQIRKIAKKNSSAKKTGYQKYAKEKSVEQEA